jgi:hypothetical protein
MGYKTINVQQQFTEGGSHGGRGCRTEEVCAYSVVPLSVCLMASCVKTASSASVRAIRSTVAFICFITIRDFYLRRHEYP